jgi:hypothetical protein
VGSVCTAQLSEGVRSGYAPGLHSEDAWFDSQAILTYLFFIYFPRHSEFRYDALIKPRRLSYKSLPVQHAIVTAALFCGQYRN